MTSESGSITDTFAYDTYGKQTARTGESDIIFGYNGKYGVMTEPNGLVYMRARYYSPELRRFINADVIAGEISNAITLNRYAYANGNPISTVDPLGLRSLILDSMTIVPIALPLDFCYDIEKTKKNTEKTFKGLENWALRAESALNPGSGGESVEENFRYNSQIDIKNQIIPYQHEEPYSNLVLVKGSIADNGCEVIAVNNAMQLLGYDTSMANLIYTFETSGAVIGGNGTLVGGALGSNPYSLTKVFNTLGLMYKEVSIDQMNVNGVYIMSYWNSQDVDSMIHTIAIKKTDTGYELYNRKRDYDKDTKNITVSDLSEYQEGYIIGYMVGNPERESKQVF